MSDLKVILEATAAPKLFTRLSNTIEKRSLDYVNRYKKTDMQIASVIFDRKRNIRWSGANGAKYICSFKAINS